MFAESWIWWLWIIEKGNMSVCRGHALANALYDTGFNKDPLQPEVVFTLNFEELGVKQGWQAYGCCMLIRLQIIPVCNGSIWQILPNKQKTPSGVRRLIYSVQWWRWLCRYWPRPCDCFAWLLRNGSSYWNPAFRWTRTNFWRRNSPCECPPLMQYNILFVFDFFL